MGFMIPCDVWQLFDSEVDISKTSETRTQQAARGLWNSAGLKIHIYIYFWAVLGDFDHKIGQTDLVFDVRSVFITTL